jgi:hypothetical protein
MRRHHGGSWAGFGEHGLPGCAGDPSQPCCLAGIICGVRGAAVALRVQRHVAALQPRRWVVVMSILGARRQPGVRGRADVSISVIETRPGLGVRHFLLLSSRGNAAVNSAAGPSSRGRARSCACTTPILGPRHLRASPPARVAAGLDGHDQGRQGASTRCSCWAARPAAALRRSRPRRSLRCWRGLPPTLLSLPGPGPPPPARSASRPGRNSDASRDMAGSAHRRRLR